MQVNNSTFLKFNSTFYGCKNRDRKKGREGKRGAEGEGRGGGTSTYQDHPQGHRDMKCKKLKINWRHSDKLRRGKNQEGIHQKGKNISGRKV